MTVKNFKRDQPTRIMRIQQEVLTDGKLEATFWKLEREWTCCSRLSRAEKVETQGCRRGGK